MFLDSRVAVIFTSISSFRSVWPYCILCRLAAGLPMCIFSLEHSLPRTAGAWDDSWDDL